AVLHRYRKSYVNRQLAAYDLSGIHFILLLALSHHNGASQEAMADHLMMEKTTIAKSVKMLEKNGYLRRERSLRDRRAYQVYLTPQGEALIPVIRRAVRDWEDDVTRDLDPQAHAALEKALRAMAERAGELLGNGKQA
ncbi:MAG TPA: MarR family winged helix-turn-helix transcriptional regulator, partial [Candidatus Limiplasma sp.]|nr:MarR family winged helix-turn-helix transcriptional regulator [Candidatus Limiplasma sp.]